MKKKRNTPRLWVKEAGKYQKAVESFRTLENTIFRYKEKENVQTILITGVERRVGTSTAAFNLALICAKDMPQQKILLIDTDISSPSLHKSFDFPPSPGAIDFFYGEAMLSEVVQESFLPNLKLIGLGGNSKESISPFTRQSFQDFLQFVKKHYDFIFIDSAPWLNSSHTQRVSLQTDGVIVVAEAYRTHIETVTELYHKLQLNNIFLLGSFLNRRRHPVPQWLYNRI
ncbi:MAG: CpsD/CapB family tyrosine-protein kinase [Candidatus Electrothrix aestuarii]|uniref:non-specific protein-tyrosine kinase n=1 Tax=Candidatus Electrothrix aestuarii TaxID=3062594 RepID=A0AAU8M1U7_9BACT|nr:CpsD/CapB family tyrosine-protein kinase [Candidatus Electrothrix aestuarii]